MPSRGNRTCVCHDVGGDPLSGQRSAEMFESVVLIAAEKLRQRESDQHL
jgi:hypothetical protein